jgi:hypothetical protein
MQLSHRDHATLPCRHLPDREIGGCVQKFTTVVKFCAHPSKLSR